MAIWEFGNSKGGNVEGSAFKFSFTARKTMPDNCIADCYTAIENVVRQVLPDPKFQTWEDNVGWRPHNEDEIRDVAKGLLLAMQGSWCGQHTYTWNVCNSVHQEDADGPVHMWRPNEDGTTRWMTRKEILTNKTMYPIGSVALDLEHLHMFKMLRVLQHLPTPPTIHGCINDCFFVSGITAKIAEDVCSVLSYKDGTKMFKLKEGQRVAPLTESEKQDNSPKSTFNNSTITSHPGR